jgi:hypothetical protein
VKIPGSLSSVSGVRRELREHDARCDCQRFTASKVV